MRKRPAKASEPAVEDDHAILLAIAASVACVSDLPGPEMAIPSTTTPSLLAAKSKSHAAIAGTDDDAVPVDPALRALDPRYALQSVPTVKNTSKRKAKVAVPVTARVEDSQVAEARRAHNDNTARSAALPKQSAKVAKSLSERDQLRNARVPSAIAGLTDADILATKWLEGPQLALLREQTGLSYKTGKFSNDEDTLIRAAVQRHKEKHGFTDDEMLALVHKGGKRSGTHADFFSDIARSVGHRSVMAVYHRVQRLYAPGARKGRWTSDEDAALQEAHGDLGPKWEAIAGRVGRASADCRDRFRNILSKADDREATAAWTSADEQELDRIVRDLARETGADIVTTPQPDIPWGAVSSRMQGRRTRLSCSNRWSDVTYRMLIGRGQPAVWGAYDTYRLVQRVHELDYDREDAINWTRLGTPEWSVWSGNNARRNFARIKRTTPEANAATTHRECISALYEAHVKDIDPASLDRSPYLSAQGLTTLPAVPLESYGVTARRITQKGGASRIATKRQLPADEDEDEHEPSAPSSSAKRPRKAYKSAELVLSD